MSNQAVLISGAGIAGPTLAYWLARDGFRPTVVEHAVAPRSSGSPVDVRGKAVEVAERMAVMARIREAGTDWTGMSFVNGTGRRVGRVNMRACNKRPAAARSSCHAATSPRSCTRPAGTTPSSCSTTLSSPWTRTSTGWTSPSTAPTPAGSTW